MSLLTRIKAAKNVLFNRVVEASLPTGTMEFMHRYGKDPDISKQALVQKYHSWTYACANVSASRFASVPIKLYAARGTGESVVKNFRCKKVDKWKSAYIKKRLSKSLRNVACAEDFEELEEHPLLDLFRNVNDQENGYELRELTCLMLDMTGDAYWLVERDKLGIPSKLFVLRSQWVRVIPDAKNFVSGYLYGHDNSRSVDNRLELKADEVIHFKYPNPVDPWYGVSPVQAAAYAIENNELREKFMLATMSNMARPDLVVKYMEGELEPRERAAVEREWNSMFRGAKNAGKVKVTDFRYELDKIGWNPSELDFNRGEDWVLKKIAAAFPVPYALLDTTAISRAPRSGMEGIDLFMAQFNTLPRCTRIEEKLNEQLLPMYDERLFVAFDNPVQQDKNAQNAEDSMRLLNFSTTINEIRKRNGEDEVPWGDLPLAPMGIAPLGSKQAPTEIEPSENTQKPEDSGDVPPSTRGGGKPGGAQSEDEKKVEALVTGQVEKALGNGMTMEVEGQYVHPTLAGIPIQLRVRNETGKFDKKDPDKLRGKRDVITALKSEEGGRWVTMHGQPVLIREGQSAEEAAEEHFGPGGKKNRDTDEAADARAFDREQAKGKAGLRKVADKLRKAEEAGTLADKELKQAVAKKEQLAAALTATESRLDSLRKEWTSKFPNTPLPKSLRKGEGSSALEKKIADTLAEHNNLLDELESFSKELDGKLK